MGKVTRRCNCYSISIVCRESTTTMQLLHYWYCLWGKYHHDAIVTLLVLSVGKYHHSIIVTLLVLSVGKVPPWCNCYVVYWPPTPPNTPFQRRRKCIFHWRERAWLTLSDRVKIPRYSHRLMHRKRVTCELHDSYFRLMTIKHALPKTVEVHIPMASYGEILSGRELLYNRKFD